MKRFYASAFLLAAMTALPASAQKTNVFPAFKAQKTHGMLQVASTTRRRVLLFMQVRQLTPVRNVDG